MMYFKIALMVTMPIALLDAGVWINEFHYDNVGSDTGEFIEVAVSSSLTVLDQFTVSLYNGSDKSIYDSHRLDTFNAGATYNAVRFYYKQVTGIQNGPDGIVLDSSGTVIQFLSYEGTFTALDGPAAGLTSTLIPVEESSAPTGYALQLGGVGNAYNEFFWSGPDPGTMGNLNLMQTTGFSGIPQVMVTEFMANPSVLSDSDGEWIELYNADAGSVNLNGWYLRDADSDEHGIENSSRIIVGSDEFTVLGNNQDSLNSINIQASYEYSGITLTNGSADEIMLVLPDNSTVVDSVAYNRSGWPSVSSGASLTFTGQSGDDNNQGLFWNQATATWPGGHGENGSPGFNGTDQSLPVGLTSFTAEVRARKVILRWVTESEYNNQGFLIKRTPESQNEFITIASFTSDRRLQGQLNSATTTHYSYTDTSVTGGETYLYLLGDVALDGETTLHTDKEIKATIPHSSNQGFQLYPPFPNPSNAGTQIAYTLPVQSLVHLQLFNLRGQLIIEVPEIPKLSGYHEVWLPMKTVPTGMYILKFRAGRYKKVEKLYVVK